MQLQISLAVMVKAYVCRKFERWSSVTSRRPNYNLQFSGFFKEVIKLITYAYSNQNNPRTKAALIQNVKIVQQL